MPLVPGKAGERTVRRSLPPFALLLCGFLAGCTSWHVEEAPVAEVLTRDQPEVVRVTRIDETTMPVYDPQIVGTSLRGLPTAKAVNGISIALGDIRSVATKRFSFGKTVLVVLAGIGGVVLFDLLQSTNSNATF